MSYYLRKKYLDVLINKVILWEKHSSNAHKKVIWSAALNFEKWFLNFCHIFLFLHVFLILPWILEGVLKLFLFLNIF